MSPLPSQLALAWPPPQWADVSVIVAVSGGADSVALLCGLAAIRQRGLGRIIVAHYNHRLRARASDRDEAFVRELAASLDLPIEVGHWHRKPAADTADESPDNTATDVRAALDTATENVGEAAARYARYDFLRDAAHRHGARFVATAHTADDQAETVLHHVLRGTGLAGLAGISRTRPLSEAVTLIRPMLTLSRADAEQYLAQLDQPYCRDATNDDLRYTRNRIRHEVLPQLAASFNPRLDEALRNLARSAAGAQEVIDSLARELASKTCEAHGSDTVTVRVEPLRNKPAYLVRETLIAVWRRQRWPRQAMRHEHWDRLAKMVRDPDGSATHVFPGNVHAHCERGHLHITRRNE